MGEFDDEAIFWVLQLGDDDLRRVGGGTLGQTSSLDCDSCENGEETLPTSGNWSGCYTIGGSWTATGNITLTGDTTIAISGDFNLDGYTISQTNRNASMEGGGGLNGFDLTIISGGSAGIDLWGTVDLNGGTGGDGATDGYPDAGDGGDGGTLCLKTTHPDADVILDSISCRGGNGGPGGDGSGSGVNGTSGGHAGNGGIVKVVTSGELSFLDEYSGIALDGGVGGGAGDGSDNNIAGGDGGDCGNGGDGGNGGAFLVECNNIDMATIVGNISAKGGNGGSANAAVGPDGGRGGEGECFVYPPVYGGSGGNGGDGGAGGNGGTINIVVADTSTVHIDIGLNGGVGGDGGAGGPGGFGHENKCNSGVECKYSATPGNQGQGGPGGDGGHGGSCTIRLVGTNICGEQLNAYGDLALNAGVGGDGGAGAPQTDGDCVCGGDDCEDSCVECECVYSWGEGAIGGIAGDGGDGGSVVISSTGSLCLRQSGGGCGSGTKGLTVEANGEDFGCRGVGGKTGDYCFCNCDKGGNGNCGPATATPGVKGTYSATYKFGCTFSSARSVTRNDGGTPSCSGC